MTPRLWAWASPAASLAASQRTASTYDSPSSVVSAGSGWAAGPGPAAGASAESHRTVELRRVFRVVNRSRPEFGRVGIPSTPRYTSASVVVPRYGMQTAL